MAFGNLRSAVVILLAILVNAVCAGILFDCASDTVMVDTFMDPTPPIFSTFPDNAFVPLPLVTFDSTGIRGGGIGNLTGANGASMFLALGTNPSVNCTDGCFQLDTNSATSGLSTQFFIDYQFPKAVTAPELKFVVEFKEPPVGLDFLGLGLFGPGGFVTQGLMNIAASNDSAVITFVNGPLGTNTAVVSGQSTGLSPTSVGIKSFTVIAIPEPGAFMMVGWIGIIVAGVLWKRNGTK